MKKLLPIIFSLIFLLFPACGNRYVSNYKAVGLVKNNTKSDCNARFSSLEGTLVFKMNASADCDIDYSAKIEAGSISVYYDSLGQKELLFTLNAGESVESSGGYSTNSSTVYIIIETISKTTEGRLEFSL